MASEAVSLNDLPEEILLNIFSYFGAEELSLIIAKVCKWWNILAKGVSLWKTLSYRCDASSDRSHIAEVLTAAPALHSLIICEREDAAGILESLFRKHVDLRKLFLEECRLGDDCTGLLANIVDLYPDLEVLSLENCYPLTDAGCCLIPHLKKLSELTLSDTFADVLSRKTLCSIADSCQHLKKLNLYDENRIDDDGVIHVIKKLGKQLTSLALNGQGLTDVAFLYLKNCARLQELKVNCCDNMTDRGLLEGIGSLRELTSLCLVSGYNLTAQALSKFLQRPYMTSIVLLELSFCDKLNDEGLKGIAERCIHLKELKVFLCCNVTDAGISMVVRRCSQLRKLNLTYLPCITGEGWLSLVSSCLPHLRELCLDRCLVCDKYVEELKADVPQLKVTK